MQRRLEPRRRYVRPSRGSSNRGDATAHAETAEHAEDERLEERDAACRLSEHRLGGEDGETDG